MLCASGLEFEEKLHLARVEHENAQRVLHSVSGVNQNSSKRVEDAFRRQGCSTPNSPDEQEVDLVAVPNGVGAYAVASKEMESIPKIARNIVQNL